MHLSFMKSSSTSYTFVLIIIRLSFRCRNCGRVWNGRSLFIPVTILVLAIFILFFIRLRHLLRPVCRYCSRSRQLSLVIAGLINAMRVQAHWAMPRGYLVVTLSSARFLLRLFVVHPSCAREALTTCFYVQIKSSLTYWLKNKPIKAMHDKDRKQ